MIVTINGGQFDIKVVRSPNGENKDSFGWRTFKGIFEQLNNAMSAYDAVWDSPAIDLPFLCQFRNSIDLAFFEKHGYRLYKG